MKIIVVFNTNKCIDINFVNDFSNFLKNKNEVILVDEANKFDSSKTDELLKGVDVVYLFSCDFIAHHINDEANKRQIAIASFYPTRKKPKTKGLWKHFYHYADAVHYVDNLSRLYFEAKVGPTNSYIIGLDEFERLEKMLKEAKEVRKYKVSNGLHHRIVYYKDPLNDDFAGTIIDSKQVDDKYKYVHKNPFYRFCAAVLYRVIAQPFVYLGCKIKRGVKVKNPQVLKKLKKSGFFLYGNHTTFFDAVNPQAVVSRRKRAYIIANPDATSIPGIRTLVNMLGCIPLPSNVLTNQKYQEAIKYRYSQKAIIVIYPEAHIWPFYTGVRPFLDLSFRYPAELNAPVVAMVTTYRKSKFHKRRPFIDITLSEPIYPNPEYSLKENMKYLRDQVYDFMVKITKEAKDVGYINYLQAPPTSAKFGK